MLLVNNLIGFGVVSSSAPPVTAYTNAGGQGDRTATIAVTSNLTPTDSSNLLNWVDGGTGQNATDSVALTSTALTDGDHFTFDFGAGVKKYIDEWELNQAGTPANGAWVIEGSDDNSAYTQYASFTWSTATQQVVAMTGMPAAGHRYYRMRKNGTPGGNYSGLWYQEVEFKIAAGV